MDLATVLAKTVSPDKAELEAALHFVEQAVESNLAEFLKSLSDVLENAQNPPVARMAAGLQLKNQLTAKDRDLCVRYQQRWLSFPQDVRAHVKHQCMNALGTENFRPSSAAQAVAYIAIAEVPNGQWPDLMTRLTANVTNAGSSETMKEATLEAIGYICQEIYPQSVLATQSNEILTAIVHGMRKDEPSDHVKHAATNALLNSLEFTKANFENDSERDFIMQVVCETSQSPNKQVRVAALQCLVKIMSLYYQYMERYMGPALFAITTDAISNEVDEIALQGIEFWSNVCEEEVDLAIEAAEAMEQGRPPSRTSRFYAKGALPYLMPLLIHTLTKQEEHDDDDDWVPCKAAGVCVMLLATCCESDVIPHCMPFITSNIHNPDWRHRDASVMLFGSILEGPDTSLLKPLVEHAIPAFIQLMDDPSVVVRDTVAWTFGRICELIPDAVLGDSYLQPMLEAFFKGLSAEPRVASNVCWSIDSLVEAAHDAAIQPNNVDDSGEPNTFALSKYFEMLVTRLLQTTERPDAKQNHLRSAAYEALMQLMKNSAADCYVYLQKTTMVVLERFQHVLSLENHIQSASDRAEYYDLQGLLCAMLQSVLRKMTQQDAALISDTIMTVMLQMFSSTANAAHAAAPSVANGVDGDEKAATGGGVQEEALMAISSLIEQLGKQFLKYMQAFRPFLLMSLKNSQESRVCIAAVGVCADLYRALQMEMLPFTEEIMTILIEVLVDPQADKCVKPHILSAFGDAALAIGSEIKRFLEHILQTLVHASQAQVDTSDFDMVEYLNELRDGCLEAYTGIVQGLRANAPEGSTTPAIITCPDLLLLQPHVPHMVQFVVTIAKDPNRSDSNIGNASGLIGDLLLAFGVDVLSLVDTEAIHELMTAGRRSKAPKVKQLSQWAAKELRRLKNASQQQQQQQQQQQVNAIAAAAPSSCD